MAALSKHGGVIGKLDYLKSTRAYCADGAILCNRGFGWKRWGSVKNLTAEQGFSRAKERLEERLANDPALASYHKFLNSCVIKSRRWLVHHAIAAMPTDADGVWSMLDDEGIHIDLDDLARACRDYLNIKG